MLHNLGYRPKRVPRKPLGASTGTVPCIGTEPIMVRPAAEVVKQPVRSTTPVHFFYAQKAIKDAAGKNGSNPEVPKPNKIITLKAKRPNDLSARNKNTHVKELPRSTTPVHIFYAQKAIKDAARKNGSNQEVPKPNKIITVKAKRPNHLFARKRILHKNILEDIEDSYVSVSSAKRITCIRINKITAHNF